MTFESFLHASHPEIPPAAADAVLRLVADGATLPFIARYRKEQTGNLPEVGIQAVMDTKEAWDALLARQAFVVKEIERQGKLTAELREQILATFDRDVLEDLYLPFKRKRQSRAAVAREAGLEPLADWIWNCGHGLETPQPGQTLELWAFTFRNEEKGFPDTDSTIQGAQDILVERLSESRPLRAVVRQALHERGHVVSARGAKAKPHSKFEKYFAYAEPVVSLLKPEHSHRYLALRRGAAENELAVRLGGAPDDAEFDERLRRAFEAEAVTVPDSPGDAVLRRAARLALAEHVLPGVATAVHKALKGVADDVAIRVFADNVRKVLLASPFGSRPVVAIDPGIRTGCKVAVVDAAGTFVTSAVLHLKTDDSRAEARGTLITLVQAHGAAAVAIGNGTAGREAEQFARQALHAAGSGVPVVMVSEAGASIYSASEVARQEFPALDVTVRGAISIARRLQDPLAELVKSDPKHIGVGQYQHDVPPHLMQKSLDLVVDSCVNQVGVDLNTASEHLLQHVAGIGPALASALVAHRAAHGLFRTRAQLAAVPRFSRRSFEQAAGFLRIAGGEHPLDNTGVHPERYDALERLATGLGVTVADLLGPGVERVKQAEALREEVGAFTFADIVAELEKPGRDPREVFVPFQFRADIHALADLKPGLVCPGIVTNVTTFGAFVDIGVHQDGLVHVSRLSDRFVKDPHEVVSPGNRVEVRVVGVDLEKGQIALTMKRERPPEHRPPERTGPRPGPPGARPARAGGQNAPAQDRSRRRDDPRDRGPRKPPRERRHDDRGEPYTPPAQPAFNTPFAALRDALKPRE